MLRVLATWDPKVLPAPHDSRPLEDDAALGVLPGIDAETWYAIAWDPRDDYVPSDQDEPCGFMREGPRGIEVKRHPESILRDTPRLWDVVTKWRSGVTRDLSREDFETLDNFEIECWLTMVSAHAREMERRYSPKEGDAA